MAVLWKQEAMGQPIQQSEQTDGYQPFQHPVDRILASVVSS